jgi:uncharacterized protein (TIGR02147 family)
MSSDIFKYNSYNKYLRDISDGNKAAYSVTQLARFAGVQRSYFSNVLGDRANLNADQGFRLSQGLHHNEAEQAYFLDLIEYERASSPEYKSHLKARLTAAQTKNRTVTEKLDREAPRLDETVLLEYFSSWECVAVHTLTSIPEFQTQEKIAGALRLPPEFVEKILQKLEDWKLIAKAQGRYTWLSGDMHVPHNSPAIALYHREWRERALENARRYPGQDVHFTSLYSVSEEDFQEMRSQILEFIKQYSQKASGSREQKAVVFNIDHFKLV